MGDKTNKSEQFPNMGKNKSTPPPVATSTTTTTSSSSGSDSSNSSSAASAAYAANQASTGLSTLEPYSYESEVYADDGKDGEDSTINGLLGLCVGVAIATAGVSVAVVIADVENDFTTRTKTRGLFLATGLAAVGNVKRNWAEKLAVVHQKLGEVPPDFASDNGGNFKAWTILGHLMMIGISKHSADGVVLPPSLVQAYGAYKTKVSSGNIMTYESFRSDNPKEKKRDAILSASRDLFNRGNITATNKFARDYAMILIHSMAGVKVRTSGVARRIGAYKGPEGETR